MLKVKDREEERRRTKAKQREREGGREKEGAERNRRGGGEEKHFGMKKQIASFSAIALLWTTREKRREKEKDGRGLGLQNY